jgi:Putative porin
MKAVRILSVVLLLAFALQAQTAKTTKTSKKPVTKPNAEMQALKDAMAAQQSQIQQLSQQLQQTNQQLQQTNQQFQQTQQQLQQAQQAAADAQQKASAVADSAAPKADVDKLNSEYADVQTALTNNAISEQEQQKRFSGLEETLGRFRWTGDVRVRDDSVFQKYSGCVGCNDRNRARVRVRFGFEGKINDDFIAGVAIASGSLSDPTTTNETLTNFFQRKTIGLDRGYITYNPVAAKWLSITAGKFAYTWQRTSVTFDPDINPEGFVEKISKDINTPIVKNVNFQLMQLLYNEASGAGGLFSGRDSFAFGGQFGARLQPTKWWTMTPSFSLINFRYQDALLNASAYQAGATSYTATIAVPVFDTLGNQIGTTNGTTTIQLPAEGPGCNTPKSSGYPGLSFAPCAFAPNGMTNATFTDASGKLHFLSNFLYADLILNNQFKTRIPRLPINLLLEYENNLNASNHPFDFTYANNIAKGITLDTFASQSLAQTGANTSLGKQSHAYLIDFSVGQQKKKGDFQIGYAFERQEQDAVIASWSESDQRAPTNILQHRVYGLWRVANNTTASISWWHGRTLDPYLQNGALAPGMKVVPAGTTPAPGLLVSGSGAQEPWLNRFQFDLIYSF